MNKFINWLGYNSGLDRKNRFTYIILAFCMFMVSLFLVLYIIFIPYFWVVASMVLCLFELIFIFFLLKLRKFTLAKYLMIFGFLLQECLLVFFLLPVEASLNYFFFIATPMTFFVFDFQISKEKIGIIIVNIIVTFLLVASEVFPLGSPIIPLSPQLIRLFSGVSVFASAGSIAIVFYYYGFLLHQTYQHLNLLVETDGLTQIPNRRTLLSEGKTIFDICRKSESSFAFILFDIDFFKKVNDEYGHPEGDVVLVRLSELIQKNIRHNDVFARYGGEEFGLIIKNTDGRDLGAVAEALRKLVEKTPFILSEGQEISLSVSIGMVSYSKGYSSFEEIVSVANKALYRAKQSGRNQVVFAESE